MKKYFFFALTAAMMSFAGCQKNEMEDPNAANGEGSTFELVADVVQTKTTLDASTYKVAWENDDVLYVVTAGEDTPWTEAQEFKYADGKFSTKSTIVGGNYTMNALYAASSQKEYHKNTQTTHKIESVQMQDCINPTAHIKLNDALAGTFTVTVPQTSTAQVDMHHLYTLMQVNVKNKTGNPVKVTKFEMTAEGANLAGVFKIDSFDPISITYNNAYGSNKITVELTGGTVAADAALPVYFVMAPLKEYSGNITFVVTDSDGKTYSKTIAANNLTFAAGTYNTTPYTISTPDKVEAKGLPFEETFASGLGEFTKEEQLPEGLTYVWSHDATHKYAKASAYVSGTRYEQTSYLVSPVLDLTNVENAKVQFDHTGNYFNGTETTSANLCIREVGGDWETIEIPTYWSQNWAWVNSGDIDISKFSGKLIQVGFRYSSTTTNAGTWEIKNLKVSEGALATEINVADMPETVEAEGGEVSVSYSITNPKDGKSLTASADVAWITAFDYSTAGQVKFAVAANESTEARSGVVTLSYDGAESVNETVNQKGQAVAGSSEVIIVFADLGYENGAAVESVSSEPVTVTFDKGTNESNAPKYYNTGSAVRTYGGNSFTIAVSGGNIVGIELTYASDEGANAITSDVGVFSGNVWSGSAQSVTLTIGGTTGHRRIQKIKVSYISGGEVPKPEAKTLESIAVENPKTEYTVGDQFVAPTVKATYSDAPSATVNGATFSGYDMTTAGTQTVTVSYTEGEVSKTTTYQIIVKNAEILVANGTYVIAVKENETYYAASIDANSTRRDFVALDGYSSGAYVSHNSKIVWTITNVGSGITVSAGEQYWKAVKNGVSLAASDQATIISVNESETVGAYLLSADCGSDGIRYLSKNDTYGFGFYADSNKEDVYLIPTSFVELPTLSTPVVSAKLNDNKNGVVVSWGQVQNAEKYVVTCGDNSVEVTGLSYEFTDLAPSTYSITVTAVANNYNSSTSEPVTVDVPSTGSGSGVETVIFKESFGNNSSSARAWSDTYKEQSGVASVYSSSTYVMTNVKQGKNTTGNTKSGLNQSSTSNPAYFEVKNLNVLGYSNFKVSYYWKAGSIKATYYTKLYYSTDGGVNYTEVEKDSGTGATAFVEVKYTLPESLSCESLSIKVEFSTSNTQATIDDVLVSAFN